MQLAWFFFAFIIKNIIDLYTKLFTPIFYFQIRNH